MMPETEVKIIIGEEESYIPGFGGYRLEYPSKDVFLTFLNDDDTDFHHKVNRIEVTGSKYEVFGINVGHKFRCRRYFTSRDLNRGRMIVFHTIEIQFIYNIR